MSLENCYKNKCLDGRSCVEMLGDMSSLPLPEGWIGVNHYSGGIIYLHKKTRVVTWSKPYHIGESSLRKHDIPVTAIPCLHQLIGIAKYKEKHSNQGDINEPSCKKLMLDNAAVQESGDIKVLTSDYKIATGNRFIELEKGHAQGVTPPSTYSKAAVGSFNGTNSLYSSDSTSYGDTPVECRPSLNITDEEGKKSPSLKPQRRYQQISTFSIDNVEMVNPCQFEKYLSGIFNFKHLTEEESHQPIFGEGSKGESTFELPDALQTIPFVSSSKGKGQDDFTFTPGKTHLSLLNEYCNKRLKKPVQWIDGVGDGDEFVIEALIDGIRYGTGEAKSKKAAKQLAAKHTLEVLIPEKFAEISSFSFSGAELAVFDKLNIDDPKVTDCIRSVGLPLPVEVLSKCLKRNRSLCDTNVCFKLIPSETDDLHTFEIICGKHVAMGTCKNRKIGKQLASQAILKKIHPKLEKWGQIVRLYCHSPEGLIKESKKFEADKHKLPETKLDLLRKLKHEMRELEKERRTKSPASINPKIIAEDLDL